MSRHDPSLGEPRNAWRGDEIARSAQATLYQATGSYGCQVARLALVEKGVAFKSRYVDLNSDTTQVRGCGSSPTALSARHSGLHARALAATRLLLYLARTGLHHCRRQQLSHAVGATPALSPSG